MRRAWRLQHNQLAADCPHLRGAPAVVPVLRLPDAHHRLCRKRRHPAHPGSHRGGSPKRQPLPLRGGRRCGRTVVHRLVRARNSGRTGWQAGPRLLNWRQTTRWTSASIGERAGHRFRPLRGWGALLRPPRSHVLQRGPAIGWLRALKLNRPGALGNPKPVPHWNRCG